MPIHERFGCSFNNAPSVTRSFLLRFLGTTNSTPSNNAGRHRLTSGYLLVALSASGPPSGSPHFGQRRGDELAVGDDGDDVRVELADEVVMDDPGVFGHRVPVR